MILEVENVLRGHAGGKRVVGIDSFLYYKILNVVDPVLVVYLFYI